MRRPRERVSPLLRRIRARDESGPRTPSVRPSLPVNPNAPVKIVPDAPPVEPTLIEEGPVDPFAPPGRGEPDQGRAGQPRTDGTLDEVPPIDAFVVTDVQPEFVSARDPLYPDLPREAGVEGSVTVRMLVGMNGHVERAVVYPPARPTMFDEAAVTAALTSVFTPALATGHPVRVWVSRTYRFKLH